MLPPKTCRPRQLSRLPRPKYGPNYIKTKTGGNTDVTNSLRSKRNHLIRQPDRLSLTTLSVMVMKWLMTSGSYKMITRCCNYAMAYIGIAIWSLERNLSPMVRCTDHLFIFYFTFKSCLVTGFYESCKYFRRKRMLLFIILSSHRKCSGLDFNTLLVNIFAILSRIL